MSKKVQEVRLFPRLDLRAVGTTDSGEPLFRVVLGSSRFDVIICLASGKLSAIPTYLRKGWVLEKHLAAKEFYGCTPEEYAANAKQLGFTKRYQSEGEYDSVHFFESVDEVQLAPLYARIARYGHEHLSLAERRQVVDFHEKQELKRVAQERRDIIAEAAPSRFGRVAERVQLYDTLGKPVVM